MGSSHMRMCFLKKEGGRPSMNVGLVKHQLVLFMVGLPAGVPSKVLSERVVESQSQRVCQAMMGRVFLCGF